MSDSYYNIVLLPNAEIATAAVDLSHKVFSEISDGYCLEAGKVFPHITLGQFRSENSDVIQRIMQHVQHMKEDVVPDIAFSDIYAKPDKWDDIEYLWIELVVVPSEELSFVQEKVHLVLQEEGLVSLNPGLEAYRPHLTLARMRAETPIPLFACPDCFKVNVIGGWKLAIGHSDRNGQLLGVL